MKSFIRARVFKSCDVEVSSPRMLKSVAEFQPLPGHLEFLKGDLPEIGAGEELPPNWQEIQIPVGFKEVDANSTAAAMAEADKIIEEARAKAEEIVKQAQIEAEGYKDQLAAMIKSQIEEQAYQEGFDAGLKDGKNAGQKIQKEAENLLVLATKAFQEEYAKTEDGLIHLSVKIAERILRAELSIEPQRLLAIVRNVALLPHERSNWRLHVSSQDALWLKTLRSEQQVSIPLVEDDVLNQGDCFLECEEGIFDARLESQLGYIEEYLREEFKRGGLEQAVTKD